VNRRTVVRGLATAGTAALAGCGLSEEETPAPIPVRPVAVDVLNVADRLTAHARTPWASG